MKNFLPKDKKEWSRALKNACLVLAGTFILAFGIEMFIFPFDLVTGGISGIGIILEKCFEEVRFFGNISAESYSAVINWLLFALGY